MMHRQCFSMFWVLWIWCLHSSFYSRRFWRWSDLDLRFVTKSNEKKTDTNNLLLLFHFICFLFILFWFLMWVSYRWKMLKLVFHTYYFKFELWSRFNLSPTFVPPFRIYFCFCHSNPHTFQPLFHSSAIMLMTWFVHGSCYTHDCCHRYDESYWFHWK